MSTRIKDTPILIGDAAYQFDKRMLALENRKVSERDYSRARQAFNSVQFKELGHEIPKEKR